MTTIFIVAMPLMALNFVWLVILARLQAKWDREIAVLMNTLRIFSRDPQHWIERTRKEMESEAGK